MNQERLAQLIQAQREALPTNLEGRLARETILGILILLDQGTLTQGRALRLLRYQAVRLVDEPVQAARYRQAATALRHMQRAERGTGPADDAGNQDRIPSCEGHHVADSSQ